MQKSAPALLLGLGIALGLAALEVAADGAPAGGSPPATPKAPQDPAPPQDAAQGLGHLHEFAKVTERLYRSAQPETEEDFRALAELGIKTIVSVDGARPDVETARKYGIRYVHVPIGYEGVPAAKAAVIAKAVTTYPGPFLFHCHHGKHRGPAACAIALRFLDGADAATAETLLKEAGTAPKYAGLYRDVREFKGVSPQVLAAIPGDLPEAVVPQGMRAAMVALDQTFERMKGVRKAGWQPDPEHPDVSPAHEATILAEAYREMQRLDECTTKPESFRTYLAEAEKSAWALAKALEAQPVDAAGAAAALEAVAQNCVACHKDHRDNR